MRLNRGMVAAVAAFGALLWLERRWPLRPRLEPRGRHDLRNLAMGALAAAVAQRVEAPMVERLAELARRRRWGIVPQLRLRRPVERAVMLAALDYALYLWHILTHRVPLLWRFHRVHHCDADLSATTALRFHAAEIALSVPWRAAQVLLIGADRATLRLWQRLTLASILFHHSNLRLPRGLDRALALAVATPRLHGIHHSSRPEEMSLNWSSGLTLWDRLHGTLKSDVPQATIAIGVPDQPPPAALALPRLLLLPFGGRARRRRR